MVTRGQVWWARSPSGKTRPYLVLTRHVAVDLLHALIVVPATRTIRDIPTEVLLGPEDGMPERCALSLDNLTLMPKAFFTERICELGPERLWEVCEALHVAVDC